MHTEVFAASAGLDITGVLALQPLHKAAGQLPTQEWVLSIGLLSRAQAGHLWEVTTIPTAWQAMAMYSWSATVLCGPIPARDHPSKLAPGSSPTVGAS